MSIRKFRNGTFYQIHIDDSRLPDHIVLAFGLTADDTMLGPPPARCPILVACRDKPMPDHDAVAAKVAVHGRCHVFFHGDLKGEALMFCVRLHAAWGSSVLCDLDNPEPTLDRDEDHVTPSQD